MGEVTVRPVFTYLRSVASYQPMIVIRDHVIAHVTPRVLLLGLLYGVSELDVRPQEDEPYTDLLEYIIYHDDFL